MALMLVVLQIVLPLGAIAWLAGAPLSGMRTRAVQTLSVGLLLLGLWFTGAWIYPPAWAIGAYFVLFAAACWRAWRQPLGAHMPIARAAGVVAASALAALGGLAVWQGLAGRVRPADTFDLSAPLRDGRYCVVSGGASPLLNFHFATLASGFADWRGQSYGVDLVAVGADGGRARSLLPQPTHLGDYRIYGARIHAPCTGTVLAARDGLPDQIIGSHDRRNLAGNHISLICDGRHVLLAHLQPGSVRVQAGDAVSAGDLLGLVGNSGNSDEPHLHISAQRPPAPGAPPQAGEPVHVTFGGRFLARGDCF